MVKGKRTGKLEVTSNPKSVRERASKGPLRKYAHDLRNAQKKLDLAVDIILALQKIINIGIPKSLHSEINLIPTKIQKQINALTKGGYRG